MGHLFAVPESPHHVGTLLESSIAFAFNRPVGAGNPLVQQLAAADSQPEALGVHLPQRRRALGDDCGVVAIARRVDCPEREVGRLERGAEPRPDESRLALPFAPGVEVIGGEGVLEPDLVGEFGVLEGRTRGELFVGDVIAEVGHGRSPGCRLERVAAGMDGAYTVASSTNRHLILRRCCA